jgi:hypothetical protein
MVTRRIFLARAAVAFVARRLGPTSTLKVGVCTRDVASAAKYGFDYIEPAAAEMAAVSKDQLLKFSDTVLA